MRLVYLVKFHLNLYRQNSYFVMTMLTSTVSIFLIQYLIVQINHQELSASIWLRSGIFGLWASGTTAAGVIGMQRWQGTLLYIINNAVSDYLSLIAVVMPACLFGLCSFPVAWLLAVLFGVPLSISWQTVLYIIALWIGSTTLDFVIASLFVLTPHAIVYEELVTLPTLLISGVFTLPSFLSGIQVLGEWLIPIAIPTRWLLGTAELSIGTAVRFLISEVVALSISYYVTRYLIKKAQQTGVIGGGL